MKAESVSIFRRCTTCNKLLLKDEQHECQQVRTTKKWELLEAIFQILDAANEEMNQVDITRIINKQLGHQKYCQFEIAYKMQQKPEIFFEGSKKYHWKLKIWESKA
ncbi:MAG: hypothetical protein AB1299_09445 [Thermoproteota archaeon]